MSTVRSSFDWVNVTFLPIMKQAQFWNRVFCAFEATPFARWQAGEVTDAIVLAKALNCPWLVPESAFSIFVLRDSIIPYLVEWLPRIQVKLPAMLLFDEGSM